MVVRASTQNIYGSVSGAKNIYGMGSGRAKDIYGMGSAGAKDIYSVGGIGDTKSIYDVGGGGTGTVTNPCDCSQLQTIDNYIKQLTRILNNLNTNRKNYIADAALDNMVANIRTMINSLGN
jgi:hypothetical protein